MATTQDIMMRLFTGQKVNRTELKRAAKALKIEVPEHGTLDELKVLLMGEAEAKFTPGGRKILAPDQRPLALRPGQGPATPGPSPKSFQGLKGVPRGFRTQKAVGKGMKGLLKFGRAHPVMAGLGFLAADFAPDIIGSARRTFGDVGFARETEGALLIDKAAQLRQKKLQDLQQSTAMNAMRLAQTNPHLANEILAGRKLPQGAVVLGGTPRDDLLESVAMGMAQGDFGPPTQQPDMTGDPTGGLF